MNETKRLADRILRRAAQDGSARCTDFPECFSLNDEERIHLKNLLNQYGEFKLLMPPARWEKFEINEKGIVFVRDGGFASVEAAKKYQAEYRKADLEEKKLSKKKYRLDKIALVIAILSLIISVISLMKGFL